MYCRGLRKTLSFQLLNIVATGKTLYLYQYRLKYLFSNLYKHLYIVQSHWQGGRLTCPYHVCHTCSSDNPQDNRSRATNERMAKCVRCPSSYHASTLCLPAGSIILTASQIICPKHYKAPHPPLNAAWCFLCTRGGSLICCDTCPTSFHLECLGNLIKILQCKV